MAIISVLFPSHGPPCFDYQLFRWAHDALPRCVGHARSLFPFGFSEGGRYPIEQCCPMRERRP